MLGPGQFSLDVESLRGDMGAIIDPGPSGQDAGAMPANLAMSDHLTDAVWRWGSLALARIAGSAFWPRRCASEPRNARGHQCIHSQTVSSALTIGPQ